MEHLLIKVNKIRELMDFLDSKGVDYSHLQDRYFKILDDHAYYKLPSLILKFQELVDLNQEQT